MKRNRRRQQRDVWAPPPLVDVGMVVLLKQLAVAAARTMEATGVVLDALENEIRRRRLIDKRKGHR